MISKLFFLTNPGLNVLDCLIKIAPVKIFPRDLSNIAVVDYENGNDVDFIFNRLIR